MHMCMVTEIIIYQLQLQEVLCHGYPSFIKVPDVHVWCPQEDTLAEDLSASVDPAVINFALEDLVLIVIFDELMLMLTISANRRMKITETM